MLSTKDLYMKTENKGNQSLTYLGRCYRAARAIFNSDSMILSETDNPTHRNRVNLHYWDSRIEMGDSFPYNLGDNLSEPIVEWMLRRKGLKLDSEINFEGLRHLYAIGSVISLGYQNATIWGSGILQPLSSVRKFLHSSICRKLDIRAVRGPLTRDLMLELGHKCPEVYGDPALLMPLIYQPQNNIKRNRYLIIPHFSKEKEYRHKVGDSHIGSMITKDYTGLLDKICTSEKVISGSMHGIILAEAYGIPSIFLRDRAACKDFKYKDYYLSTNREFRYATSLEEAIDMEPMALPKNIAQLQEGLINSFPYDLWDDAQNK